MSVKEITLIPSRTSSHQNKTFLQIEEGLKGKCRTVFSPGCNNPETQAVACWGWRKGEMLRAKGHDVLVFERAYLGDRFSWTSIGWNGLNGRADFCLPKKLDPSRFSDNFAPLAPWREDGEYILIMGQVPGDMSLAGRDLTSFYEDAADKLSKKYGKPAFFRPHPHGSGRNFRPKIEALSGELEAALEKAFLVVTYNSNSAVDAVIRGIPAFSADRGSMAWAVTSHNFDDKLARPDRTEWAIRLAHCQWTPEEIARGDYWGRMNAIG